jgi:hypothetical protein
VRCKSRQRFREGGFFHGFAARCWCGNCGNELVAGVAIYPALTGWWRQTRLSLISVRTH